MIRSILKRLAYLQENYPVLVILFVLTVTAFLGYYAFWLETDSSFNVMMREDSQSRTLERLVDSEFGGTDVMFVLIKSDEGSDSVTKVEDIYTELCRSTLPGGAQGAALRRIYNK